MGEKRLNADGFVLEDALKKIVSIHGVDQNGCKCLLDKELTS